jgi:hypothetical protein
MCSCVSITLPAAFRKLDQRRDDLISDALPFDRLWYGGPNAGTNAMNYAKFFSRFHDAVT